MNEITAYYDRKRIEIPSTHLCPRKNKTKTTRKKEQVGPTWHDVCDISSNAPSSFSKQHTVTQRALDALHSTSTGLRLLFAIVVTFYGKWSTWRWTQRFYYYDITERSRCSRWWVLYTRSRLERSIELCLTTPALFLNFTRTHPCEKCSEGREGGRDSYTQHTNLHSS